VRAVEETADIRIEERPLLTSKGSGKPYVAVIDGHDLRNDRGDVRRFARSPVPMRHARQPKRAFPLDVVSGGK
jgi:hypothetical protein